MCKKGSCKDKPCDTTTIEERVENGEDCIAKRVEVMDTCFRGGDIEHWNKVFNRLKGVDGCYGSYVSAKNGTCGK
jgi:Novel toxin 16